MKKAERKMVFAFSLDGLEEHRSSAGLNGDIVIGISNVKTSELDKTKCKIK